MRVTTIPFDLPAWRVRMGWTQEEASDALGLSVHAYRRSEYRCKDRPGSPVAAPVAKLANLLERDYQYGKGPIEKAGPFFL